MLFRYPCATFALPLRYLRGIFRVSLEYLQDKCRYSLLQTKTAIPSISGITVLDRDICQM